MTKPLGTLESYAGVSPPPPALPMTPPTVDTPPVDDTSAAEVPDTKAEAPATQGVP
jgi:hypothetical protein